MKHSVDLDNLNEVFGVSFSRALKMDMDGNNAFFLWSPRKIGEKTYLRATFPEALFFEHIIF